MVVKRIIYCVLFVCFGHSVHGQVRDKFDLNQSIGKTRVQLETGNYFYKNTEKRNYNKFGFGAGIETLLAINERSHLSLAPALIYNGVNETLKTYSVENSSYYYRSTTLTGRLMASTALYYKHNLGRQLQVGIGFQPNICLHEFKDQYILGESISAIPDISFRRTEISFLASVGYVIDPYWMVNIVGQYAVNPVAQVENSSFANGIRMQLSRKLR